MCLNNNSQRCFFCCFSNLKCVCQSTASEATLVALLAARSKTVRKIQASNPALSEGEIFGKLVSYTSEQVCIAIVF